MQFLFREKVVLIKHKDDRHAISLGTGQESINKSGGSLRIVDSDHQQGLIDVGGEDMTLFTEIRRLSDNIITPILNSRNKSRTFLIGDNFHMITHSHRIGTADALQSEITLDFTFDKLAIVSFDGVPASCIFDD